MAKRLDVVEEKFLNTIKENNLIISGDKIIVGVSGGPDSLTLLTLLYKYKEKFNCQIIVAHVNHLIRKDSTDDEQFVKNLCKKYKIRFYCKRVNVIEIAKNEKRGTEEIGREERYKFFNEICEKENARKIAIAHNMNDNAETMLLNLIRGTGLNGLEGIKPFAKLDTSKLNEKSEIYEKMKTKIIIRPLINCKREEIENYCKKNNLEPRIDSTNKENIYKRNVIRNNLIPFLKELNPNIVETLSRTSNTITENNDFMKEETYKAFLYVAEIKNKTTNKFFNKKEFNAKNQEKNKNNTDTNLKMNTNSIKKAHEKSEIIIDVKKFNNLPVILRKNVILLAIEKITGNKKNISKQNIDDITKMAENNIGNKKINFDNLIFTLGSGMLTIRKK